MKYISGFLNQGGFKFSSETSAASTSSSDAGFKFGGPIISTKENKVVPNVKSDDTTVKFGAATGFKFGNASSTVSSSETKTESKTEVTGGFKLNSGVQFGSFTSKSEDKPTTALGSILAQTSQTIKNSTNNKESVSALGNTKLENGPLSENKPAQASIGGFSFGTALATQTASKDAGENKVSSGGFSFGGATKATDNNVGITIGTNNLKTQQSSSQKSNIGGFSFGQKTEGASEQKSEGGFAFNVQSAVKSEAESKPDPGLFTFGQKPAFDPSGILGKTDTNTALGTSQAPAAKSTPFQFGKLISFNILVAK